MQSLRSCLVKPLLRQGLPFVAPARSFPSVVSHKATTLCHARLGAGGGASFSPTSLSSLVTLRSFHSPLRRTGGGLSSKIGCRKMNAPLQHLPWRLSPPLQLQLGAVSHLSSSFGGGGRGPSRPPSRWAQGIGLLGAGSLLLGKTKYILAALKLTKFASLGSMLFTIGTYSMFFGLPYAVCRESCLSLVYLHGYNTFSHYSRNVLQVGMVGRYSKSTCGVRFTKRTRSPSFCLLYTPRTNYHSRGGSRSCHVATGHFL
jgi:hypothetical protein